VCLQRQARRARLSRPCMCTMRTVYVLVHTVRPRAAAMESFTTVDSKSAALAVEFATNPTAGLLLAVGLQFTGLIF